MRMALISGGADTTVTPLGDESMGLTLDESMGLILDAIEHGSQLASLDDALAAGRDG